MSHRSECRQEVDRCHAWTRGVRPAGAAMCLDDLLRQADVLKVSDLHLVPGHRRGTNTRLSVGAREPAKTIRR